MTEPTNPNEPEDMNIKLIGSKKLVFDKKICRYLPQSNRTSSMPWI